MPAIPAAEPRRLFAHIRRLQRILETDDISDEWGAIDRALWEDLKRIRGRPDIEGAAGLEDECIGRDIASLPGRFGGVDLLSHKEVSPHARAAAQESADIIVDEIFEVKTALEESALRSQSARCREMWEDQRRQLLRGVDGIRAKYHASAPFV